MATEKRILVYYDDLVMGIARVFRETMDTHIYSPRDILSAAQGIRPVDAVEVVRCKDCKHCVRDHTLDAGGDEYYYCWHVVMEHGQARANEFCSYGERKSDEVH